MKPIVFATLAATLMVLSGQPAWAELRGCLCSAALADAAFYADGRDVWRYTDYDWDTADPGVASAISQAKQTALSGGRAETVDIGITEQRIGFGTSPLNSHRRITLLDRKTVYVSYLFCRWSRPADRLYEIGLAYSKFPGDGATSEMSAYVPSDLHAIFQQRCEASRSRS